MKITTATILKTQNLLKCVPLVTILDYFMNRVVHQSVDEMITSRCIFHHLICTKRELFDGYFKIFEK